MLGISDGKIVLVGKGDAGTPSALHNKLPLFPRSLQGPNEAGRTTKKMPPA